MRSFILANRWPYLIAVVAIGGAEFLQVQIPHLLGLFINDLKAGTTQQEVVHFALALAFFAACYVVAFGFGQLLVGRLARTMEYEVRQVLFRHWERLSSRYFQQHSVGDLLNHTLTDVTRVRQALSQGMNQVSQAVFLFGATLYMTIGTINLQLTLFALMPLLLIPVVIVVMGPRVRMRSRLVQEGLSNMAELAEESFLAIRLIKATSNEDAETARFQELVDEVLERQMKLVELNTLFQALLPLLSGIAFVIGLLIGGDEVIRHVISLGAFVAFSAYLAMMVQPLLQFGRVINTFQNASASLVRLQLLLEVEPDIVDPEHPVERDWRGDVDISHLTYRYPGTDARVLDDASVHVPAGSVLGIVGRTGAGKTTLVNLILRDYDPPRGTIKLDGVDIRDIRLDDLRDMIAYVPQDGFLFSTTIGENIAFPLPKVVPEAVERAASQSHILDTIRAMPAGIHTEIGERGIMLSGGQRQRAAIARALIKSQAKILILDDSLSAVDTRTETDILRVLRRARGQKTTIIVAHRLSALRDADRIIVLDRGAVVESGTHDELMRVNGIYAELFRIQLGEVSAHA
jgi:ATP-binding cassette subfamily B multidrug efflux pump